jgi:precorrin-6Y C5,15-methyltransferase (decarboxylating)
VDHSEFKTHVIGIGSDGLGGITTRGRELIAGAEMLFGSESTLALVPEAGARRVRIGTDLQDIVRTLETNRGKKRMVVLARGDPLFYGVARYLCDRLGKDQFEVLPHVSSMQLAFARIKESWEEAFLTNLATHPLATVLDRIRVAEIAGLFTSEQEDPSSIARELLAAGIDYFRGFVCENLGGPDERVTQGELADIQHMEFAPLNVMILKRKPDRPDQRRPSAGLRRFGNPDDVFAQSRPKSGLITQAEVRAISLSLLDIQPGSIVWDVGAGSGSLAIEAAQLAHSGMVYAIEQVAADYHLILANAQTFGVTNVTPVHSSAPAVFASLPAPDGIFVGGTGHEIARLLQAAFQVLRPGGRLESLSATYAALKSAAGRVEVLLVNVARGVEQLETLRFEAVNPTFLLSVTKPRIGG